MKLLLVGVLVVLVLLGPGWTAPAAAQPDAPAADAPAVTEQVQEINGTDEGSVSPPDLLGTFIGPGTVAEYPWTHYEIGASVGIGSRVLMVLARLFSTVARWTIRVADFAVGWVMDFDLGRILAPEAAAVAAQFSTRLIGPLGFAQLALLLAIGRAAWLLFLSRSASGASELLVAGLILALSVGATSKLETVACGGLNVLGGTTLAILDVATTPEDEWRTADPPDYCDPDASPAGLPSDGTVAAFRDATVESFVTEPFLVLQWGQVPTDGCLVVADALVAKGAWGDSDEPRDWMEDAGCPGLVAFNQSAGAQRLVGALVYLLAAVAFAVAVLLTVGTLLMGQIAGAVLVLSMPFALTVGIAPGAGRELLGRWFHGLLKVAVLFLGSALFLVMLIVAVQAVQAGMADEPVLVRLGTTTAMAWGMVIMRRHLLSSMRFGAQSIAARTMGPGSDVGDVGQSIGGAALGAAQQADGAVLTARSLAGHAGVAAGKARPDSSRKAGTTSPTTAGRAQRMIQVEVASLAGSQSRAGAVAGVGTTGATGPAAMRAAGGGIAGAVAGAAVRVRVGEAIGDATTTSGRGRSARPNVTAVRPTPASRRPHRALPAGPSATRRALVSRTGQPERDDLPAILDPGPDVADAGDPGDADPDGVAT